MELIENLSKSTIPEEIQETFEPVYNVTRLAGYNGNLYFTADKIYWVYADYQHVNLRGWCISVDEIASYSKRGLAAYRITLKDGKELNFSNVFGKKSKGITDAIEKRI